MRITLEHYGEKISIEVEHDDLTAREVTSKFRGLLLAAGFHVNHIDENIKI